MSDNKGNFKLFTATYTTSLFPDWVASPDYFNLFFLPSPLSYSCSPSLLPSYFYEDHLVEKKNSARMEREREKERKYEKVKCEL